MRRGDDVDVQSKCRRMRLQKGSWTPFDAFRTPDFCLLGLRTAPLTHGEPYAKISVRAAAAVPESDESEPVAGTLI